MNEYYIQVYSSSYNSLILNDYTKKKKWRDSNPFILFILSAP